MNFKAYTIVKQTRLKINSLFLSSFHGFISFGDLLLNQKISSSIIT